MPQRLVCLDLEGVLIPEIWIAASRATGIEELSLTTRDIADYDELMGGRIAALRSAGIGLAELQAVAEQIEPLPGAREFLDLLRSQAQVCVLSDTFTQFAGPVMGRLGYPTIFCNELTADSGGAVTGYRLRQPNGKEAAVRAFRGLNLDVYAVGDSFNDIGMLRAAAHGVLFRPSDTVVSAHPDLPVASTYAELDSLLLQSAPDMIRSARR